MKDLREEEAAHQQGIYATARLFFQSLAMRSAAKAASCAGPAENVGELPAQTDDARLAALRKAAAAGDTKAQCELGFIYEHGLYERGSGAPPDRAQAIKWYLSAAEHGLAAAQYNLANLYLYTPQKAGFVDITDMREEPPRQQHADAAKWFAKAADQGLAGAQIALGVIYESGDGMPRNQIEAVKWFRKAADQGSAEAEMALSVMYELGEGVTQDYAEGAAWCRKAAEQDNAYAQTLLGILYWRGQGIDRNPVQAHMWLSLAAAKGFRLAFVERRFVADQMPYPAVVEAQRLAQEWTPKSKPVIRPASAQSAERNESTATILTSLSRDEE